MTLKAFLTEHGMSTKGIQPYESKTKTYQNNPSQHLLYILLEKDVNGQTALVCSQHLAEKLVSKGNIALRDDAEVSYSKETSTYGLICKATHVAIGEAVDL